MDQIALAFDAEPRAQHRDPIYLQPRRARRIETIVEPAFLSARISDPETSIEAAKAQTGRTERLILELFRRGGLPFKVGMTDDELAWAMGHGSFHAPTVKSARSRLTKAGLLEDSGTRRPSNRGRQQIAWRLSP